MLHLKRPDYKALGKLMELLDTSPRIRRMAWAVILVALIFALGYLSDRLPRDKLL